jgi:hypothetical protein
MRRLELLDEWRRRMSERKGSRWTHFLMMLPFFLIGVAIPVYYFGFSGDGPPKISNSYEPPAAATPEGSEPTTQRSHDRPSRRDGVVAFTRGLFERAVDTYVSPGISPTLIKFGVLAAVFAGGFLVIRLVLALISSTVGGILSFLVHKAAGPMFMGFLAVGSTWGIHQTVAQEFGMTWAATTVSLTAAIATLFALAGVRLRN